MKVGGAVLEEPASRARFAASVRAAVDAGLAPLVVHGGGVQLTRLAASLGLETERVDGLRVTSHAMARAALQALAGEVNGELVAALSGAGVRALGVTGADAGLMRASVLDPALGLVGEVSNVDATVLDDLIGAGFVPVVATLAPSPEGFLNVNADDAVAPLARAADASAALFLSDVAHVLGESGEPLDALGPARAEALRANGTIAGGMVPKVAAALSAAQGLGPGATVRMGRGDEPNAVLALLAGGGTTFHAEPAAGLVPGEVTT
ncbi:MAG: acetylglutamate kinase [Planctomycetota bacterium]